MTDSAAPQLPTGLLKASSSRVLETLCFHCGTTCEGTNIIKEEKAFCCLGCQTVFELLTENGLGDFYRLSDAAGVRVDRAPAEEEFRFLDEPAVRKRLVDFADDQITRVTFRCQRSIASLASGCWKTCSASNRASARHEWIFRARRSPSPSRPRR
jgi:hypothetical protein